MDKIKRAFMMFDFDKDQQHKANASNNDLSNEFKNITLSSFEKNYGIKLDPERKEEIFGDIERLSSLINQNHNNKDPNDKLTLLDQMFYSQYDPESLEKTAVSEDKLFLLDDY